MDKPGDALNMFGGDIQARLYVDFPDGIAYSAKFFNKSTLQTRLATTKSDAAAGRLKIQVVNHDLCQKRFWREDTALVVGIETLRIQAIMASQRAAVKTRQRCYAIAITPDAVAVDPDKFCLSTSHLHFEGCKCFFRGSFLFVFF